MKYRLSNALRNIIMQGKIEVFTSGGKLLKKFTASQTSITVAKVFGTLLWLGLSNGRVVAVDTLTHQRCAAMPVHDTAVQDLQQVCFLIVLVQNRAKDAFDMFPCASWLCCLVYDQTSTARYPQTPQLSEFWV